MDGAPAGAQPFGLTPGVADQGGAGGVLVDADQQPLARRPGAGNGVGLHVGQQLLVHPLRRASQRQFAQRGEVSRRKIMANRPFRGARDIDLALLEPLDQVVRRDVDDLDVVGAVHDGIRHGFPHADAGDFGDDVVQAFDMLDVQGGVDVDAGGQQLLDVEIALGVAGAGGVGVGQLVHQHDGRAADQDGVEVHLVEQPVLVVDPAAGNDLQPGDQRFGFPAPVGFDHADDDVDALAALGLRRLQHLEGLADAGGGAEEDFEPATVLPCRLTQQRVGRWAGVALLDHPLVLSPLAWCSTLTGRRSPCPRRD